MPEMGILMDLKEMGSVVEALLFAAGEPVSVTHIAETLEMDIPTMRSFLDDFMSSYNYKRGGLRIIRMDDNYQICTRPEHYDYVRKLLEPSKNQELSRAALEVLSVIAYNQPIIKSVIEQVRGVDCSGVINKLLARDLIEEKGRHNSPGRPILYGTTREFLRCFGLTSLQELPGVDMLATMEQVKIDNEQLSISGE